MLQVAREYIQLSFKMVYPEDVKNDTKIFELSGYRKKYLITWLLVIKLPTQFYFLIHRKEIMVEASYIHKHRHMFSCRFRYAPIF